MTHISSIVERFFDERGMEELIRQRERISEEELLQSLCEYDFAHDWQIHEKEEVVGDVRLWVQCEECRMIDAELVAIVNHIASPVARNAVIEGARRKLRERKKDLPGPMPPNTRKKDAGV